MLVPSRILEKETSIFFVNCFLGHYQKRKGEGKTAGLEKSPVCRGGYRGRARGTPPPLFLDQTETRMAERNWGGQPPPPYIRVWMTVPPPPPYLEVWIWHWSGSPRQVDFLAGQVTCKAHVPNGRGSKQVIF